MKPIDLWLTLWGLFIALLVTAFYELAPDNLSFLGLPLRFTVGVSISAIALALLAISVNYYVDKHPKDVPSVLFWKLTLKSNNNEIEALGTEEEALEKVLVSWRENIEKSK
jgi:hypothetical protein